MANQKKTQSRRGRPPLGKKAFCIRMTPQTHAQLCRAAHAHGLQLGGWLEWMTAVKRPMVIDDEGQYDPAEAARRFGFVILEACSFITEINEMCDLEPSLAKQPRAKQALQEIHDVSTGLFQFLESEGVLKRLRGK